MRTADLDLHDQAPDSAPDRAAVTSAIEGAERVVVSGPVPALGAVLAALHRTDRLAVPVSWRPSDDPLARGLARSLGFDADGNLAEADRRERSLIRDDRGGVLLARGRVSALVAEGRPRTAGRFGAHAYHDDQRVADGEIARIDVRPDWSATDSLKVTVHRALLRRGTTTHGRAIQIACDEAQVEVDGVALSRPVTKLTWYADHRLRWNPVGT